jgi:hypothetical protein
MLPHLLLIRVELRRLDALLARGIRFGHGPLLLLLSLLLFPRRLVRRRARHLRRWRHAVIDRGRMALGFGLRMQSGGVVRISREAVNDLRLGAEGRRRFRLSRRGHCGRLFRLRDIDRPQHRYRSDEREKPGMDAGTSHAAPLKRTGRNSDNGSYVKTGLKDRTNGEKESNQFPIKKAC